MATEVASICPFLNALRLAESSIVRKTLVSSLPGLPHHRGLRSKTSVPFCGSNFWTW